ncbi:MAG TPA: hypothetical protein ENK26_04485 [Gammaproteobacteria bacterium]|nr:hypothetical protein [Gammaproteobacteria bacterium]
MMRLSTHTLRIGIFVGLFSLLSGCAAIDRIGAGVRNVLDEFGGKGRPRGNATVSRTSGGTVIHENKLEAISWSVYPEAPKPGETVTSEIRLIAYAAGTDPMVDLTVNRTLVFDGEQLPFGRPHTERVPQGNSVLSWEFTLPSDADPGRYELITKIVLNGQSETLKSGFVVR